MLCDIYVFATHDLDIDAEFPHEYSAWADGDPCYRHFAAGPLSRQVFEGITQTRTVTTEGLQGPSHNFLNVPPPKFPPCQLVGRRCDHSIIAAVEAHAQIIVYAIDTLNPDDYDSLPAAMQGMRLNADPIKETVWDKLLTGLVNVTPPESKDQLETAMSNWRTGQPDGTAEAFGLALRRYTS